MENKCPCCKSVETKVSYDNLYDKSYFIEGKFSLIICNRCKMQFVKPILNERQLAKYYPKNKYYSFKNKNKVAMIYHKISAYYHSKKNILVNILFYPFKTLFYTYYLGKKNGDKRLLEIGCGDGLKLDIYQRYGVKTNGLEPYGSELTREEEKLGIARQSIKDAKYEANSFDYIVLKEVLEHIPNQELVLRKCHEWIKQGGKLIITIPHTDGLWCKLFGRNWFGYDVPRHLYNYNKENIKLLLKKFGFKINKIRAYDPPYMLTGSLKYYLIDKTKKREQKIIRSNFLKILLAPVSLIISCLGLGSLIEIECTK